MYDDCMETEDAEAELHEMGLSDELLHYLGFYGEGDYKLPDKSQADVMAILRDVVFWFKRGLRHRRGRQSRTGGDRFWRRFPHGIFLTGRQIQVPGREPVYLCKKGSAVTIVYKYSHQKTLQPKRRTRYEQSKERR